MKRFPSAPKGAHVASPNGTAEAVPFPNLRQRLTTFFSHQREAFAQVHPTDFRIAGQLFGLAVAEDSAIVNDVSAIGYRERFAHVVIGDQDSDAAGPQAADNFLQVENGDGIDPGKRFVEQNEGWIDAQ